MNIYLDASLVHFDHIYLAWIRTKLSEVISKFTFSVKRSIHNFNPEDLFAIFGFTGLVVDPKERPVYKKRKNIVSKTSVLFTCMNLVYAVRLKSRTSC